MGVTADQFLPVELVFIPALLGAETAFKGDAAPWTIRANLSAGQVEALEKPDFKETCDDNIFAMFGVIERYWHYGA